MYEDEGISISELIGIVLKHFKLLLLVFGLVVLASLTYITTATPTFTATTTVAVDSIRNLTAWNTSRSDTKNITVELQFLTKRETVLDALSSMDLSTYTHRDGTTLEDLLTDSKKIKALQKSVEAAPVKDTNSAVITFKHTNVAFAQDFIGALIPAFDRALVGYATSDLQNQAKNFQNDLQKAETLRQAYQDSVDTLQYDPNFISLRTNSAINQRILSHIQMQIADISVSTTTTAKPVSETELTIIKEWEAKYSAAYRTVLFEQFARLLVASANEIPVQQETSEAAKRLQVLEDELATTLADLGYNNTTAASLLTNTTNAVKLSILSVLEKEYIARIQEHTTLNLEFSEQSSHLSREKSTIVSLTEQLKRLDSFISQSPTALISIESPKLENENGDTNKMLILAVGILLGAAIALLSTLLAEYLSDSITDIQACQKILGPEIPILSTIPATKDAKQVSLETIDHKGSPASVSYYQLASILLHGLREHNVFPISSLGYGEGTTYTVMNTALALAQSGKRVLVIGTATDQLLYQKIYSLMSAHEEINELIHFSPLDLSKPFTLNGDPQRLYVVTTDVANSELSQLLHSREFAAFIQQTSTLYDLVLIDAPTFKTPANLIAVAQASGVLVINIRTHIGSRKQLKNLLTTMKLCNIPVHGVVLNNYLGKPSPTERSEVARHNKRMQAIACGLDHTTIEEAVLLNKTSGR